MQEPNRELREDRIPESKQIKKEQEKQKNLLLLAIAGIVLARRAKRADYRKSLTTAIGMLCSITGALLCFLTPVLSLLSNVALFFMTR